MLSFRKVVGEQADPINLPISLDGIDIRPGHVVLLIGAWGAGKSVMGLLSAVTAHPSVVVSLDTDTRTQFERLGSKFSGEKIKDLASDPDRLREILAENDKKMPWFVDYDPEDDWEGLFAATKDFFGKPSLVVIDNLLNVARGSSYEDLRKTLRELVRFARGNGVAMLVLHHSRTSETGEDRAEYKVEKEPDVVLLLQQAAGGTDYRSGQGTGMTLTVQKNRHGPSRKPDGSSIYSHFYIDFQRMRIT